MSFRQINFVRTLRRAVLMAFVAGAPVGAWAETAPAEPVHSAAAPFGALSLFILGGVLLAGLFVGAGAVALRCRRRPESAAVPVSVKHVPRQTPAAAPPVASASQAARPAGQALPPVAGVLGRSEREFEDWFEALLEGPRFGPRVTGIVGAGACDKAEALAAIAAHARASERDIVIVETGDAGPLAEALDRRIGARSRRRDPFGAHARIEVVEPADLFETGVQPDTRDWHHAFFALSARNDIVLVDLPPAERLAHVGPLLAALDETAVLRAASLPEADVLTVCAAARAAGARVTHQVVVGGSL